MEKVLIIEDDEFTANVVSLQLKEAVHETAIAGDSIRGVELSHRGPPDLIILDLVLPGEGKNVGFG